MEFVPKSNAPLMKWVLDNYSPMAWTCAVELNQRLNERKFNGVLVELFGPTINTPDTVAVFLVSHDHEVQRVEIPQSAIARIEIIHTPVIDPAQLGE